MVSILFAGCRCFRTRGGTDSKMGGGRVGGDFGNCPSTDVMVI